MDLRQEIVRATGVLKGKALSKWRRAGNMAGFEFGRKTQPLDVQGNVRETGEWALDVQCAWRILHQDAIVVASRDVYYPAEYSGFTNIPSDFDWERDPNLRDKLLRSLFKSRAGGSIVQNVDVGIAGNLHISLDGDVCLEIFVDDSLGEEHWRLFEIGKSGHFVVTGRGTLSDEGSKVG